MCGKPEPEVAAGRIAAEAAGALLGLLGAFIDGICVCLVRDDGGSVSRLSRDIETFPCRVADNPSSS